MTEAPKGSAPKTVLVPFLLATACGLGFAVSYGFNLGTPVFGATLGGACLFLCIGLSFWSKLIEHREPVYVEERSLEPSPPRQWEAFTSALTDQPIPRSKVLWYALMLALGAMGAAILFPLRSLYTRPGGDPDAILAHTAYRPGSLLVTDKGEPVKPSDLEIGSVETVFAKDGNLENANSMTLLIKVPEALLDLPPQRLKWVVDGVIAYSRVCTHAGCPVGLYADEYHLLMCPCHHSVFDVLDGAKVVSGPAPRPLPQLPLGLNSDGYLIALSDFKSPVGPGYWGRPT